MSPAKLHISKRPTGACLAGFDRQAVFFRKPFQTGCGGPCWCLPAFGALKACPNPGHRGREGAGHLTCLANRSSGVCTEQGIWVTMQPRGPSADIACDLLCTAVSCVEQDPCGSSTQEIEALPGTPYGGAGFLDSFQSGLPQVQRSGGDKQGLQVGVGSPCLTHPSSPPGERVYFPSPPPWAESGTGSPETFHSIV